MAIVDVMSTTLQTVQPRPIPTPRHDHPGPDRIAGEVSSAPEPEVPEAPRVEIIVPVYNEEPTLVASIDRLHRFLDDRFPIRWTITIVDNASTDATWCLARALARALPRVRARRLDVKGRGHALRKAWSSSTADVVAYLDVDLSTDLDALYPLVAPLISGHSGIAIGTRLATGAHVERGLKREVISRVYNRILRTVLRCGFTDAQCGFKALRRDVVDVLVPMVLDDGWFFDTELLLLAERNGIRIHEVPVDWVDDPNSSVDLLRTAADDLRGVWRLWRTFANGGGRVEAHRLAGIGGVMAGGRADRRLTAGVPR